MTLISNYVIETLAGAKCLATDHREDARKSKKKSNEGYCCLVTKYNPRGPDIRKIINKHHKSIICRDEKARDILPEKVIRVSFKRNANLKELLAPSNPYGKENTEVEQFCMLF
jgi:hypothetical protein